LLRYVAVSGSKDGGRKAAKGEAESGEEVLNELASLET
jgi:hypothetical protein